MFDGLKLCGFCHWRFVDWEGFRTRGSFTSQFWIDDTRVCEICWNRNENAYKATLWDAHESENRVEWKRMAP